MTRRQAAILAQLARGTMTTWQIATTLDERLPDVSEDCRRLVDRGMVKHTPDGWKLTEQVAA